MDETKNTVIEPETADAGIALSIRLPLVLDPDDRNTGGLVVRAWNTATGEVMFTRRLDMVELNEPAGLMSLVARLTQPVPPFLLVAYDGDDGAILHATVIDAEMLAGPEAQADDDAEGPVDPATAMAMLTKILTSVGDDADADAPCPLCEETATGAGVVASRVHRECLLARAIGPLGHHLDHDFWCENMDDPHAGLGARQGNLKVADLVDRYGLAAVVNGDFPKETR
jgi:hypothetical protein